MQRPRNSFARGVLGWVLFVAMAIGLFVLLKQTPKPPAVHDPPPSRSDLLIECFIISTFVFAGLVVHYYLWRFVRPVRSQISFEKDGIREQRRTATRNTNWHAFDSWSETENLFVLLKAPGVDTRKRGFYVPKRYLRKVGKIDEFRWLISSRVGLS